MERKLMYGLLAAAIIAVFLILVYINIFGKSSVSGNTTYINAPVPQPFISMLNVASNTSNAVGIGSAGNLPSSLNATPLVANGLPEVLYVGADYCPYCAVTRWGLIIALMRFGSFSKLHYMISNGSDVYPNTPTFTFYNSSYSSRYISFVPVETQQNNRQQLQQLTSQQQVVFSTYDINGGIPFIDFANRSVALGALVLPSIINGYSWNAIAGNLTNPSSAISQSIVGSADAYTTEICIITNFTPTDVCSQPYVSSILRNLKH